MNQRRESIRLGRYDRAGDDLELRQAHDARVVDQDEVSSTLSQSGGPTPVREVEPQQFNARPVGAALDVLCSGLSSAGATPHQRNVWTEMGSVEMAPSRHATLR